MFKYALIYGMTSEEFWFGNPQDYFVYQDAFVEKQKQENDKLDITAWMYGRYNMEALYQVYNDFWGKSHKEIYPREPRTFTENAKPKTAEEAFEKFKAFVGGLNFGDNNG